MKGSIMGDPRVRSGSSFVDPKVADEADATFGEPDWQVPEPSKPTVQPSSATRPNAHTRQTLRRDEGAIESDPSHVAAKDDDRVAAVRELYARGDADAALALARSMEAVTSPPPALADAIPIIEDEPLDEREMTRVAVSASTVPPAPRLSSLTERHGVPRLVIGLDQIAKLPIDHRAGFLLGCIDGMQTMEEILDVCAMPPGEALDLIRSLVDMGVIVIE